MRNYIIRRLAQSVFIVLLSTVAVFLAVNASGDPAALLAPMDALPAEVEALRVSMGLDQPIHQRYIRFWTELFGGELDSFRYKKPPFELIVPHFYRSLLLTMPSLVIAGIISLPLGVLAASQRGKILDGLILSLALVGQATPIFLLSVLLIWVFAVHLEWLPVSGRGSILHFILPVASLTAFNTAILVRMTRATMVEVLGDEYVRTARAKGLVEGLVVIRHALRNALIPIVSLTGLQLGTLISGALVIEWIFAWPGIGKLLYDSVVQRDMPLVMVGTLGIVTTITFLNLAVDLTYTILDPRISYD